MHGMSEWDGTSSLPSRQSKLLLLLRPLYLEHRIKIYVGCHRRHQLEHLAIAIDIPG